VVQGRISHDIRSEREQLVATLRSVGPDAPTLARGWRAADVASHVAAQDRGRGVPARLARTMAVASGRRLSRLYLNRPRLAFVMTGPTTGWDRSLHVLAKGPPPAVLAPGVAPITLWEHFVHHEDVRRPAGVPRASQPDLAPVLDWILQYNRRALGRALRIDTGEIVRDVGSDGERMTVRGDLADVVMWLSGRDVPGIEVESSQSDADALRARLAV
jgi:uncharacterized protein (TIGR03085 family)